MNNLKYKVMIALAIILIGVITTGWFTILTLTFA